MELLALLGLLIGVGYMASGSKSENVNPNTPANPFKTGDPCKAAFDSVPDATKQAILQAMIGNNKANILVAANSVRLINPTLAKCLDDLADKGEANPPKTEIPGIANTDCEKTLNAADPGLQLAVAALLSSGKGSKVSIQLAADKAKEFGNQKLADCLQVIADKTPA